MENLDVDLGLSNFTLNVHSSEKVNEISVGYLLANIPMLAATITINLWVIRYYFAIMSFVELGDINLWVIRVIQKKEKSRINTLIVWDCFTRCIKV